MRGAGVRCKESIKGGQVQGVRYRGSGTGGQVREFRCTEKVHKAGAGWYGGSRCRGRRAFQQL